MNISAGIYEGVIGFIQGDTAGSCPGTWDIFNAVRMSIFKVPEGEIKILFKRLCLASS